MQRLIRFSIFADLQISLSAVYNALRSPPKMSASFIRFKKKYICNFLDRLSQQAPISNVMQIRPLGPEFMHAYRRTDMTKVTVAFRGFACATKNYI